MKNLIPTQYLSSSGIYIIRNSIDERIYVGSASHLGHRYSTHACEFRRNNHRNKVFQNFVNKYGINCLSFELLEVVADRSALIEREQHYLDTLKPFVNEGGFNILRVAGSTVGYVPTEEARRKISESNRNRAPIVYSEERRKRLSAAMIGKVTHSPETIERTRQKLIGRKLTEEQIQKFVESRKGKTSSPEVKEKIRKSILQRGKLGHLSNPTKKPIIRLCVETNSAVIYNSLLDAAKESGVGRQSIKKSIELGSSHRGYKWSFKEAL